MSIASSIGDTLGIPGVIEVRCRDAAKIKVILERAGIDSWAYGKPWFGSVMNFQVKRSKYHAAWTALEAAGIEITS